MFWRERVSICIRERKYRRMGTKTIQELASNKWSFYTNTSWGWVGIGEREIQVSNKKFLSRF